METIMTLTSIQRKIIEITQNGLPMSVKPFEDLALQIGISESEVIREFEVMKATGLLRRIAVVPNHYALGYIFNGMTVWDVPDEKVLEFGERLSNESEVSHCYERPRILPEWRYNIFAMIHGKSKEQVEECYQNFQQKFLGEYLATEILYSTQILKKTGLRIPTQNTEPVQIGRG